ncbi:uncharacterized protein LOC116915431 [Daphnia magna]|uniref:uncharacterized protein LOC116915431 n=1 Tax=Daphnia magna TaxID=35525 RepID=UPI001E1BAE31|nr:uncharacterized protein LOC116915431 [Daphnia magna]
MGPTLRVTAFLTLFLCSATLEWNAHSLLQPGTCPQSKLMPFLDIHQITGRWIIQQLPWPFPQCCRQPTLNFEEEIVDPKKASNETQPIWIRMTVDFPSCKNEQETWQQPLSWRLLQNRINEGIFLVKLPWPLDVVGVATLNFVSTDYKKFAIAYVCHNLLLEHITIPFIMVRMQTELDFSYWQRMKWALIKQGVLSAWALTETKGQCNEVFDYSAEDLFYENHSNSSENYPVNDSTESSPAVTSPIIDGLILKKVQYSGDEKTTEIAVMDPDAEWITTENFQKPDYPPLNSGLWPAVLIENQPESDQVIGNPNYIPAAEVAPLIAPSPATSTRN